MERILKTITCAFMLIATVIGCMQEAEVQNDVQDQEGLQSIVFHAGWAPETKTVLQEDGSIWWSPGDEISVFVSNHENVYKFTSININPAAAVDFSGSIPDYTRETTYALYPYDENASCEFFGSNNESVFIYSTVPTVQYVQPGTFSKGLPVSVARLEKEMLSFHNVCGGIKFSVASEGITKVVFTSRRFYSTTYGIAGGFGVCIEDGAISNIWSTGDSLDADGSSKITVYPSEGEYFIPGEYYYVAIIPTELAHLEMTFYKDDSFATYFCSNAMLAKWGEIKRGNVKRLLEKDKDLEYVELERKYARMSGVDMWQGQPEYYNAGFFQTITDINFNTSCETLKGEPVRSSIGHEGYFPVYVEIDGAVVNFYTEAEYYLMDDCLSFCGMSNLRELDLSMIDTRNLTYTYSMFMNCESLERVDLSHFNTSNVTDMSHMFFNCRSLEQLDLSCFSTANVDCMYCMFALCTKLKSINLCNAEAGKLNNGANAGALFYNSPWLTKVDLGELDLSTADCGGAMLRVAKRSNNCAILCTPGTRSRLCEDDTNLISEDVITWYVPGESLPEVVEPKRKPELYYSSDFSMDKKTKLLNKATEGAGITLVLAGEAYSDRLISDGTYENDMKAAMEAIFSVEPLKSYRHLFNVYMIYAVSMNEVIDEDTAFSYYNEELHDDQARFGEHGLTASFDFSEYSNIFLSLFSLEGEPKHVTSVIVVHDNWNRPEGFAFMHPLCDTGDEVAHDCPTGIDGTAVIHKCDSEDTFKYIVCHEFGHAFAALYEEYVDRDWSMPTEGSTTDNKAYIQQMQNQHGWWNNIDFTDDPQSIRWHAFMADSRYDESNVSIIEGARYAFGVWRSMDESIMGSTYGHYSVPAREAIYKVINTLAYGDSWQYDYESFVQQDLKNITSDQEMQSYVSKRIYPARANRHYSFKIVKSFGADGREKTTVIMN